MTRMKVDVHTSNTKTVLVQYLKIPLWMQSREED